MCKMVLGVAVFWKEPSVGLGTFVDIAFDVWGPNSGDVTAAHVLVSCFSLLVCWCCTDYCLDFKKKNFCDLMYCTDYCFD